MNPTSRNPSTTPNLTFEPRAGFYETTSPHIAGTAREVGPHCYQQEDLVELAAELLPAEGLDTGVLRRFFRRTGVSQRHLALPAHAYRRLDGLKERNDAWLGCALELGERVVRAALAEAEVDPHDVGLFVSTTVTGLSVPTLDARLMNRIALPRDAKRVPLFGLGCVAGAAGIARAADYLRAFPKQAAVLLSVELCSLTFQRDDSSVANLVATGLFGDGAAAVVLVGADHPRAHACQPWVVDSQAFFFDDTERVMGWDFVDSGFKIVLGKDVPGLAEQGLPGLVDGLLGKNGLRRQDVAAWIAHPGGPAVIDAMERSLELPPEALAPTRRSLAEVGNLSSSSVLFLLDERRKQAAPRAGEVGLLLAMGPAFCAEAVLLGW